MEVPFSSSDLATLLPTAFWLLLLLPGVALARRLAPRDLESPSIVGVAVAYVVLFACLAPLVALGYVLEAPIWMLAALLGALILWGGWDCLRRRHWKAIGKVLLSALCLEMLVVAADMVLSQRTGAMLGADARIHLTRVRFLHEHGLSNLDPFVAARYPFPAYHTNLWHALLAGGSRLCAIDPLAMWFGSLAASKLMIASGMAYLAWAVLGGRWAAWVAAVMVIIVRGPTLYSLYPNQLAPWFLLPVLAGVLARTVAPGRESDADGAPRRPDRAWVSAVRVAATTLVVGMFHPLYAAFALVACGPTIGLAALVAWIRSRRPQASSPWPATWAAIALLAAALPMPLVAKMWTAPWIEVWSKDRQGQIRAAQRAGDPLSGRIPMPGEDWMHEAPNASKSDDDAAADDSIPEESLADVPDEAGTETELEEDEEDRNERGGADADEEGGAKPAKRSGTGAVLPVKKAPGFTIVDGTSISRTPGRGFTGGWWRVWTMLGAAVAVLLLRRRMAPMVLLGFVATVLVVMLVPPLCTKALRVLGSLWMLERFETLADVLWIPLSAPALAAVLEPLLRWRWVQSPLSLLAIPLAFQHGHYASPYDWQTYWNRAEATADQRFGREYRQVARLQQALRRFIPAGSVVLVDPSFADRLTMLHDFRIVASQRSSTGVPFMRKRTQEVRLMLDGKTREGLREELIASHGIGQLVERGAPRGWVELWARDRSRWGGYLFIGLAAEPDWNRVAWKRLRDAERMMRRGRHAIARPMIEAALAEISDDEPGADLAWFRLGNACLWTDDPENAIGAYERAIAIRAGDPRYELMLGNAHVDAGLVEESIERFETAAAQALAEEDPNLAASAWFNLGNTYFRLERWGEALAAYDESLLLRPLHPQARYWRGEAEIEFRREAAGLAEPEAQQSATAGRPALDGEQTPSISPTP
jgi:tetratricopeptide (TPR) repeat protein